MKIRNHKNKLWCLFPPKKSLLNRGMCYTFKKKSSLMRFINGNFDELVNSEVTMLIEGWNSSTHLRCWAVWYNDKSVLNGAKFKPELRQMLMRNKKWQFKPDKISKKNKKYFAFSDKVIRLMCKISDQGEHIESKDAKKLVQLFNKRGFKDFKPTEDDLDYINYYIEKGIDFYHWSDRCNWLRTKTVIEFFHKKALLN